MENNNNNFLIVVDGSYFMYYTLFGSVTEYQKRFPEDAAYWIKPVEQCDQNNLPNLLNSDKYKKILKEFVMKRLETVDYIAKQNFQDQLDAANRIDVLFAMDDRVKYSFRTKLYPEYKLHRTLIKRQYQIQPIKDYVVNIIFKELDVEGTYGYTLVKVEGAEGDDVIATALMRLKDNYAHSLLIASDHDFLQIDNVREFDLFGREAKRTLGDEEVSASDFLLGKILMGDRSDNIKQVFTKCGPKTALKWTKDKEALKNLLKENQESAQRFNLNKKIISFGEIPKELSDTIYEKLNEALYKDTPLNKQMTDLKQFMAW